MLVLSKKQQFNSEISKFAGKSESRGRKESGGTSSSRRKRFLQEMLPGIKGKCWAKSSGD